MSGAEKMYVERTDDGFWTYLRRSPGELPGTPLQAVLNWILEQLNFGHVEKQRDRLGDVVSMTIGRAASAGPSSDDEAVEHAKRRLLAVDVTGLMAGARESGIAPEHADLSRMVTQQSTDWSRRNTEFHYAFELIKVLARLNKKTFNLEAPPIMGLAPASVVSYLRESTRCWLYGFHGASVALGRACLEEALKARLPARDTAKGTTLEILINAAERRRILDDCMAKVAHAVRDTANKFLHGESISEKTSRETLDATRSLVEQIFSS
jgi:hypothetical protein